MSIITQCEPTDPGAMPSRAFPNLFVRETHSGLVVGLYERNGYDDSDFLAVVWNPAAQKCETITYASTRGWTYANGAAVDAPPEIMAAAREWQDQQEAEREALFDHHASNIPEKGSRVLVKVSRGKNKSLNGRDGVVFWIGPGYGYQAPPRAGVEIGGQKVFLDSRNLYAIHADGRTAEDSWADAIGKLAAAKYWAHHLATYTI